LCNVAQFYLGAVGTGAYLHYHADAWNAQIYGEKGWVLGPPENASNSVIPAVVMVNKFAADDSSSMAGATVGGKLRCVQRAGDMVFVPEKWSHMTYNLATSIGLAKTFDLTPLRKRGARTLGDDLLPNQRRIHQRRKAVPHGYGSLEEATKPLAPTQHHQARGSFVEEF